VYARDWDNVRNYRFDGKFSVARPMPWAELAGPADMTCVRWYDGAPRLDEDDQETTAR
jgi:hypothetical protein